MSKTLMLVGMLLASAGAGAAQSNLPALAEYPDAACTRPVKPVLSAGPSDAAGISRFNAQIKKYNAEAQVYVRCVNQYVSNANADMALIHAKSQAATDAAGAP